jgi:hypothetical protein
MLARSARGSRGGSRGVRTADESFHDDLG